METSTAGLRERLQAALGGAYTLERELGGGGMSHVFVAHDAALGRDVVVKVLPPDAAAALSAERFKREIALAARLQHPHIVPVLAAGVTADGLPFYTMPLVEGESLRARLDRAGELPVPEAVSVLKDVARALAYAHGRGVVHRDIKPDNVLLSGGAAVVTDFGVAKAVSASATAGAGTSLTQLGVALGTPAYMAPEQAAADPAVDHRADLYALGCVAYELLTGQPPFAGRPVPALLAAHVSEAPEPVQRRRPNVPGALAALVMRCLEKRPADRPASAEDVLRALDAAGVASGDVPPVAFPATRGAPPRTPLAGRPWLAALGLLVVLAVGAGGAALWLLRPRGTGDDAPVVRVALQLDADEQSWDTGCSGLALAPDARFVVYNAIKAGLPALRIRFVDQLASRTVDAQVGACPTVSPDGRWVAAGVGNALGKVAVDGGPPRRLSPPAARSALAPGSTAWVTAETIVATDGVALWAIPSDGGPARPLAAPDTARGERALVWPHALPDGSGVLYASWADPSAKRARIGVVSLDGSRRTVLDLPGTFPVGVVADRLVYVDAAGAVRAVPFDMRRWRVTGNPVTLIDRVAVSPAGGAHVALSRTGALVYLIGERIASPVLVGRDGARRPLAVTPRAYSTPRYSPDGTRIAFGVGGGPVGESVWIHDLAAGTLSQLAEWGGARTGRPEWSPDGRRVLVVRADDEGGLALWWQPADGSGAASVLYRSRDYLLEGVLTPDGRALVYRTGLVRGVPARDIFTVSLDGDRTPQPLVTGPANEMMPRVSPDGRWLAYQSDESGTVQVYVRPFPGPGGRTQVSVDGGTEPLWSRDGRRVFYRDGRRVLVATVRAAAGAVGGAEPELAVTARERFVEGDFESSVSHPNYDVAPDGEHLLMLERVGAPQQIVVVHRWVRELLAATGGR